MKRWAILTAILYALALILLTIPLIAAAFGSWNNNSSNLSFTEALQVYKAWGYWLWLAVLVAGQILLLLVPIDISQKRLPSRRKLKVPVIVSAFLLANLCFAGTFSLLCAIARDKAFEIFDLSRLLPYIPKDNPGSNSGLNVLLTMILSLLVFWLIWIIAFRKATKSDEPDALVKRTTRWLLRGSILELIVAVPSHIIVRRRDDCCAPIGTFWGIVTGISLMLLCFGPGVFYLFAERINKSKLPSDKQESAKPVPKTSKSVLFTFIFLVIALLALSLSFPVSQNAAKSLSGAASSPSWRGYLPADATDIREWGWADGFLPDYGYMLKARLSQTGFERFVTELRLVSIDTSPKYSDDPEWLSWSAEGRFTNNWWDASDSLDSTFLYQTNHFWQYAKYEKGFLYFKALQH